MMEVLIFMVPLSLLLIGLVTWALFWAIRTGQFEDLEGPAYRVLLDEDDTDRGRGTQPGHPVDPGQPGRGGHLYHETRSTLAEEPSMPRVMEQLKTDHERAATLLDILERQLAALDSDAHVDFDLMHDVMVYMTEYPDPIHHPTEDRLFERMRARGLEAPAIDELLREHRGIAIKGEGFRDEIEHVVDGAMVSRAELRSRGQDYVDFLRHHMAREDTEVFPVAESKLDAMDWQWVDARREACADPLFDELAEHFRALYQYIEQMDR